MRSQQQVTEMSRSSFQYQNFEGPSQHGTLLVRIPSSIMQENEPNSIIREFDEQLSSWPDIE